MNNEQKISIWNNLPSYEKRAMGDHYITHGSNLEAWNKEFNELSILKQERVLQYVEKFSKIKDHCIR